MMNRNNLQFFCHTCLKHLQSKELSLFHIRNCSKIVKLLVLCTAFDTTGQEDVAIAHPQWLCTKCHDRLQDFKDFHKMVIKSEEVIKEIVESNSAELTSVLKQEHDETNCNSFDIFEATKPELVQSHVQFDTSESFSPTLQDETNLENEASLASDRNSSNEGIIDISTEVEIDRGARSSASIAKNRSNEHSVNMVTVRTSTRSSKSNVNSYKDGRTYNKSKCDRTANENLENDLSDILMNVEAILDDDSVEVQESFLNENDVDSSNSVKKPKRAAKRKRNAENKTYEDFANPFSQSLLENIEEQVEKLDKDVGNENFCHLCSFLFKTKMGYKKHMKRKHLNPKQHICQVCGVVRLSAPELKIHMQTHDPNAPKYKCPRCPVMLSHKNGIQGHIMAVHEGIRPFACSMCPKNYDTRKQAKKHELDHEKKPFECPKCYRRFDTEKRLRVHSIEIHDRKTSALICKYCPKRFMTSSTLRVHEENHENPIEEGQVLICPVCGVTKSHRFLFKMHMLTHDNNLPTANCPVCSKEFKHVYNMRKHLNKIHKSTRKLYKCKFCDKLFKQSQNRKFHENNHIGAKPFACDGCDKRFPHPVGLKSHRRTHDPDRFRYVCNVCSKRFITDKTRIAHENKHQKKKLAQQLKSKQNQRKDDETSTNTRRSRRLRTEDSETIN